MRFPVGILVIFATSGCNTVGDQTKVRSDTMSEPDAPLPTHPAAPAPYDIPFAEQIKRVCATQSQSDNDSKRCSKFYEARPFVHLPDSKTGDAQSTLYGMIGLPHFGAPGQTMVLVTRGGVSYEFVGESGETFTDPYSLPQAIKNLFPPNMMELGQEYMGGKQMVFQNSIFEVKGPVTTANGTQRIRPNSVKRLVAIEPRARMKMMVGAWEGWASAKRPGLPDEAYNDVFDDTVRIPVRVEIKDTAKTPQINQSMFSKTLGDQSYDARGMISNWSSNTKLADGRCIPSLSSEKLRPVHPWSPATGTSKILFHELPGMHGESFTSLVTVYTTSIANDGMDQQFLNATELAAEGEEAMQLSFAPHNVSRHTFKLAKVKGGGGDCSNPIDVSLVPGGDATGEGMWTFVLVPEAAQDACKEILLGKGANEITFHDQYGNKYFTAKMKNSTALAYQHAVSQGENTCFGYIGAGG